MGQDKDSGKEGRLRGKPEKEGGRGRNSKGVTTRKGKPGLAAYIGKTISEESSLRQ